MMLFVKAFGVWILLALLAIILGALRTKFILPATDEPSAHQIGTGIFLFVQFLVIYFFVRFARITVTKDLIFIGLFWIVLTVLFEFVFGHYIMNHPWEKLLADYNIFAGRLWLLVLLNNIIAPLTSGKLNK